MRPHRSALAVFLMALLLAPFALAQSPGAPAAAPGSWASQLDELTRWVETHRGPAPCTERCFALTRLRLRLQQRAASESRARAPRSRPARTDRKRPRSRRDARRCLT